MSGPVAVTHRGLPAGTWNDLLERAEPATLPTGVRSVLVAVPHPDDETLGAGGLLHRLASGRPGPAGAPADRPAVTAVFVTDGAAGYPGVGRHQARRLASTRRDEARAALGALGAEPGRAVFLDLPDGGVGTREVELARRLRAEMARVGADLCLAPWPPDPHPDHRAVGRAAVVAAAGAGLPLWQYPIWMRHSVHPDDLSPAEAGRMRVLRLAADGRAAKQAAIATHASQLRSPFEGLGPVLPGHVLDLFDDGLEPFFVPAGGTAGAGAGGGPAGDVGGGRR